MLELQDNEVAAFNFPYPCTADFPGWLGRLRRSRGYQKRSKKRERWAWHMSPDILVREYAISVSRIQFDLDMRCAPATPLGMGAATAVLVLVARPQCEYSVAVRAWS